MKLEVGRKYKDAKGTIISVVYTDLNDGDGDSCAAVICDNVGNIATWYPLNGCEKQIGSMFRERIVECLGLSQLPIFRKVSNFQGDKVDYLVNYVSDDNTHLGIVHTSCGDALRCFYEDGTIEIPMTYNNDHNESIPVKLLFNK